MLEASAKIVSFLFHPVFYFIYVFIIFLGLLPSGGGMVMDLFPLIILSGILVLNTVIFPVIGIYLLNRNIELKGRRERTGAYLITLFFYVLAYFFLMRTAIYELLQIYLLSVVVGMVVLAALNLRWKISMHTTGVGGALAFFVHVYYKMPEHFFWPLIASVLISGLVGSSRLILKAHTNVEVYSGYLVGFTVTALIMGAASS